MSRSLVHGASITSLASLGTSQQALAANVGRRGLIVHNTDGNACYLKYGATASAASFTVVVAAGGSWTMPEPIYTGRIDAIWAADGTGSLFMTEL